MKKPTNKKCVLKQKQKIIQMKQKSLCCRVRKGDQHKNLPNQTWRHLENNRPAENSILYTHVFVYAPRCNNKILLKSSFIKRLKSSKVANIV